ncbi:MAG: radical SAM protein [Deltaproteobacteria bacterium]|nr:radical SAM protein [Deltaproteobacteria bacterium]
MAYKRKIRVGLVQIGNSFSGQYYMPYSIGLLQAYALKYLKNPDDFEFLLPLFKRISVNDACSSLQKADIVFFSMYLWNTSISLEIARMLKKKNPDIVTVFGGPQVPSNAKNLEVFMKSSPFIDLGCFGEGEIPFLKTLQNYDTRKWENVPSMGFVDPEKGLVITEEAERIMDLDEIPSPYLDGVFDPLMKVNPDVNWSIMWETNRGCPFSCAFCAWGANSKNKLYRYGMDRLKSEIDWFGKKSIDFVFCCDANFGILDRDMDIVRYVACSKKTCGYPQVFSVQNTKNSSERIFDMQRLLSEYGLQKGVNLALQTVNEESLESIRRANISNQVFEELQNLFAREGIPTFSDIILGLPRESYESFTKGVAEVIESGQYNNIQFINLTILENTEMADYEYQKKYGLTLQESRIIYHHGTVEVEEIPEKQFLVVGSDSMPKSDWINSRVYSWIVSLLFFDKLLQIPILILNKVYNLNFKDIFELFMTNDQSYPLFSELNSILRDKAKDIQRGGTEYVPSKEWLNIWWPIDEYLFIYLSLNNKLDLFYREAEKLINALLKEQKAVSSEDVIRDCIVLNRSMIKQPFIKEDLTVELSHNVYSCYSSFFKGELKDIEKGEYKFKIKRSEEQWSSWEDWFRQLVWYGKKKGVYLYNCEES